MNTKCTRGVTSVIAWLVIAASGLAFSPASAQMQIPESVIGNGGRHAAGGSWAVQGTVGQASIGTLSTDDSQVFLGYWYNLHLIASSVETPPPLGPQFALGQNSPNPFNPSTIIPFSLANPAQVQLTVFDARGRMVAILIDREMPAGAHEAVFMPKTLASGLYFYRLISDGNIQTRKLLLIK